MQDGWALLRLEDALDDIVDRRGVTPAKLGSAFTTAGHRVISAKLVKGGRVDFAADHARFVDSKTYARWMRTPLQRGDVLLTSEAPLGELAYLRTDTDWCLGQRLFALRPKRGIVDGRFLYYALQQGTTRSALHARATGTTVQGIRQSELRKIQISTPDFATQCRIGEVLGALDDKIDLNRHMVATLHELADAIYVEWLRNRTGGGLQSVGVMIDTGTLAVGDGYRAKNSELAASGVPFARAADVDGIVRVGSGDALAVERLHVAGDKVSRAWDVVVTTKGTIGRLAQVAPGTPPVVYSPQLCYWRVLDRTALSPHVLFRWMRGSAFREQLDRHAGQTDMAPYVNLRDQRSFKIAVPDSAAQMMIEPLLAAVDARIALLYRESDTLAELRDTLLPCLLSGELRVGDVQHAVALAT